MWLHLTTEAWIIYNPQPLLLERHTYFFHAGFFKYFALLSLFISLHILCSIILLVLLNLNSIILVLLIISYFFPVKYLALELLIMILWSFISKLINILFLVDLFRMLYDSVIIQIKSRNILNFLILHCRL